MKNIYKGVKIDEAVQAVHSELDDNQLLAEEMAAAAAVAATQTAPLNAAQGPAAEKLPSGRIVFLISLLSPFPNPIGLSLALPPIPDCFIRLIELHWISCSCIKRMMNFNRLA